MLFVRHYSAPPPASCRLHSECSGLVKPTTFYPLQSGAFAATTSDTCASPPERKSVQSTDAALAKFVRRRAPPQSRSTTATRKRDRLAANKCTKTQPPSA